MRFPAPFNKITQGCSPCVIVDLWNVEAIQLKSTKELIERESRMTCHLTNTKIRFRRRESCSDNNASDVVNRNHINCVRDVGSTQQLHTTFHHSDKEVVSVRHYCLSVIMFLPTFDILLTSCL